VSYQTWLARVTLLLAAIGTAGSDAIAQGPAVQYIPLKASEFLARAPTLVGQNVEVFAQFFTIPFPIEPGGSGWFSEYERGAGTPFGDVVFDKANQQAVQWMVKNCTQTWNGVFDASMKRRLDPLD
jgi:hypothetical protein